jgi:hypothetical protein
MNPQRGVSQLWTATRATTKIGLANLVHNMRRLLWLERRPALA